MSMIEPRTPEPQHHDLEVPEADGVEQQTACARQPTAEILTAVASLPDEAA